MVYSYVTEAELENNKIVLTVQVDDFQDGGAVEISGQVTQYRETQHDVVIATFYEIQNLPDPDSSGHRHLPVTVDPGDAKFDTGQEVTVVARVARVWVTVLSKDPDSSDSGYEGWKAEAAAPAAPPDGGSHS